MHRVLLTVAAVLVTTAWASGNTITIKFNGTDGVSSALWWSDTLVNGNGGTNTGGEPGVVKLSLKSTDWYYPAALYRAALPANLTNATITSATFSAWESWNVPDNALMGVELRRIHSLGTWQPGNGKAATRWGARNNGAMRLFANYDNVSGTGVNWNGDCVTWAVGTAAGTRTEFDCAVADIIGTQDCHGASALTYDVTTLVQNWANGTWANEGFVLWAGDASESRVKTVELRTSYSGRGLIINYTPAVPEPATWALLGTGAVATLGFVRRKRMK